MIRMSAYVVAAVLAAGVPRAAMAQSNSAPPAAVPQGAPSKDYGTSQSHWIVSGFVGSNVGKSTVDPSVDFGGQVAYLWRGVVGGEVLGDFAPSFKLDNQALSENPRANSYMANAILALPLGADGRFQPFFSGGLGGIQLATKVFNAALPHVGGTIPTGVSEGNQMKFASNLGGGFMGFAGAIGFRADVRYYKASNDAAIQSQTSVEQFTETLLSGLDFWRANVGVSVRW